MKLVWSSRAIEDVREIGRFIASDDPTAARRWIDPIRARVRQAAQFPKSVRRVPEIDMDEVREVILGNYRIVYRIQTGFVEVLTVFEGHRELRGLLRPGGITRPPP